MIVYPLLSDTDLQILIWCDYYFLAGERPRTFTNHISRRMQVQSFISESHSCQVRIDITLDSPLLFHGGLFIRLTSIRFEGIFKVDCSTSAETTVLQNRAHPSQQKFLEFLGTRNL
jgi:hypothetical protein